MKRTLFSLLVIALLFYLQERPIPSLDEPVQLYTTVCQDDLRKSYLRAIEQAQHSIHLIMYSLSDEKVINALNKKAKEGVEINVVHDTSSPQEGYNRLVAIERIPMKTSGLMHQKILVVDHKHVWIGSANFTTESLRLHDNLIAALTSPELAQSILTNGSAHKYYIEGQLFEFWQLPQDRKAALARLIDLIDKAEQSIRIAMYTWTHPDLAEAVIRAQERGVLVEVILDRGQANGVGKKVTERLISSGIPVWLSNGQKLLHHKCLWIDETLLINGSANWTRAAFSKNKDCFFILHDLTEKQQTKLDKMWFRTRTLSNKKHLGILWQRPMGISDEQFELISMAA